MRSITSRRNPVVARFRALAEHADPAGHHALLDGAHLVREAQLSGRSFELVAVASSRLESESEEGRIARDLAASGVDVVQAPDAVFAAMSPVRTPSGVIAVCALEPASLDEIAAAPDAAVLVAVDVQDPGNVGALARTAEAGGMTGMIACGASANPFSWKAIRGSMGSALRLPLAGGIAAEAAMAALRRAGVRTVAAVSRHGEDPDALDWRGKVALVLGGEGAGIPEAVVRECDTRVSIPMAPGVESLNVAAAGAILVYAARRGRG